MTVTAQPSASASSIAWLSAPAALSLLPTSSTGFCLSFRNSMAAATAASKDSASLGVSATTALMGPGAAQGAPAMLQATSI